MVNILETEVSTALNEGNQLLRVKADIDGNQPESFFFLRPFGANTWFFLAGRGRKGPVDRDTDTPQVVDELEESLVEEGWPIRPINNSSNYPDTGAVEVQFSGGGIHRYPLFAHGASVVVAKEGDIDDNQVDATVEVQYSDEIYEYVIHVSDGEIPDDWILEDLVIWADAVELGDTYHPHDDLRNPTSIAVNRK
ncbi:hypothetical protein [Haloferax volcanii]|uniref:hypothetical protein n=1 Tax=Haloferax volcanii TaxID=2246 RepID=UPI00385FBF13